MSRFLISLFLFILFSLQSFASNLYVVNIGAYKDVNILSNSLKKLSVKLRKTIEVKKVGNLYKARTLPTKEKKILSKLLPLYRVIFHDAFILSIDSNISEEIEIKETHKTRKQHKIKNIEDTLSLKEILSEQTYYLCQERNVGSDKKYLIKVSFKEDSVNYKPIRGNIPFEPTLYAIKNEKLFLYKDGLYDSDVYSTLEEIFSDYHLFSYWIGDIQINTVRFYHNLKDAKKYFDSL